MPNVCKTSCPAGVQYVVLKCYVLLGLRYRTERVIYARYLTVKLKWIPLTWISKTKINSYPTFIHLSIEVIFMLLSLMMFSISRFVMVIIYWSQELIFPKMTHEKKLKVLYDKLTNEKFLLTSILWVNNPFFISKKFFKCPVSFSFRNAHDKLLFAGFALFTFHHHFFWQGVLLIGFAI